MIQGGFFAIYYNAETLKRTETIENLLCVSVNILILLDLNRVETLKRCFFKKKLQIKRYNLHTMVRGFA